jgi:glycine betaine/choline ABC-type transport system substrate-binding protein
MKRNIVLWLMGAILVLSPIASACVGKTIHLGISNASNERLIAEMASMLIVERTGSTVQIDVYKNSAELYSAVRKGDVNVMFENPVRAAEIVGKAKDAPYDQIKREYRTRLNLTWLESFGDALKSAPVLTAETLTAYPALPKLLNKLSTALAQDSYAKLQKSAESADKTKKVAKDYLKMKKLI